VARQRGEHGAERNSAVGPHADERGWRQFLVRRVRDDADRREWGAAATCDTRGYVAFHIDRRRAGGLPQGGLAGHASGDGVLTSNGGADSPGQRRHQMADDRRIAIEDNRTARQRGI
jgi:hypothetical protein